MVAVAQWQSIRLWLEMLRVRVPSATHLDFFDSQNIKFHSIFNVFWRFESSQKFKHPRRDIRHGI